MSIPIKSWLAAAVLTVLVSPAAQGACRTGFVERIELATQKSKCIPQGVIRHQDLQRSQTSRIEHIRKRQVVEQQKQLRARQEIKRKQLAQRR